MRLGARVHVLSDVSSASSSIRARGRAGTTKDQGRRSTRSFQYLYSEDAETTPFPLTLPSGPKARSQEVASEPCTA